MMLSPEQRRYIMKYNWRAYTKTVVQVLITILVAAAGAYTNGGITSIEWVNVAIVGAGALSVFAAPNVPGAAYTKTILSAITAGLVVLTSVITGGIVFPELVQILVAAAGAVGVFAFQNKPELGVIK
jgi:hypothetical protein